MHRRDKQAISKSPMKRCCNILGSWCNVLRTWLYRRHLRVECTQQKLPCRHRSLTGCLAGWLAGWLAGFYSLALYYIHSRTHTPVQMNFTLVPL